MILFATGKLVRAALALWLVATLSFFALRMAGDPAMAFLPPDAPAVQVEQFKKKWNLDQPLPSQYAAYLVNIAQGDFGRSFSDGRPASKVVGERIPKTLLLLGASFAFIVVFGLTLGSLAALAHNTFLDRAIMLITVMGYSIPNFFLGLLLILTFAVQFRWLPSSGSDGWQALVLPVITIGTTGGAVVARFVRAAILDAKTGPHVRAARSRGLAERTVFLGHIAPNAALPTATVLGLLLGGLVAGGVVTETVFAWPGVGRLTVTAVAERNLAVVQTIVLLVAASMITANLAVDLLYGWLDPRVRQGGRR